MNETARGMLLEHSQVVTTSYEWQLYLEILLQKQEGNKQGTKGEKGNVSARFDHSTLGSNMIHKESI